MPLETVPQPEDLEVLRAERLVAKLEYQTTLEKMEAARAEFETSQEAFESAMNKLAAIDLKIKEAVNSDKAE